GGGPAECGPRGRAGGGGQVCADPGGHPPRKHRPGRPALQWGGRVRHGRGVPRRRARLRRDDRGVLQPAGMSIPADLVILHADALCRVLDRGAPRRGPAQGELNIVEDGALAVADGTIVAVGTTDEVLAECDAGAARVVDARGLTVLPGLVEAHSHPVFAGRRYMEYAQRLSGVSLQEIVAAGGGIWNSVLRTRAATDEELLHQTA